MAPGAADETVRIAVNGSGGRMGTTVIETAADRADVTVVLGIDSTAAASQSSPPVVAGADREAAVAEYAPTVVVDFSTPDATVALAETCAEQGVAVVVGTTGFTAAQLERLRTLSERIPVLKAANFSRGIQALLAALGPALEALPAYDIELSETHHNGKRDAPSGTAATILETIQTERSLEPVYGREGSQPRRTDEIGIQVSRLGDVRGEHTVRFGGNDEVLTIAHRAEDRAVFAAGALDAAVWLAGRNPGWYPFGEVIGEV